MKFLKSVLVVAIVGLIIGSSAVVLAHGWGRGPGFSQARGNGGQSRFMGNEMYNARIEALAEVTGKSAETIKSKLQNKPVWAVLEEYNVDFSTFQSKMQQKALALAETAVADGKITQEQADFMTQRMNQGPRGFQGGPGRGFGGGFGRGFGGNCPRF